MIQNPSRLITDSMQLIPALQQARKFWMEPKVPTLEERQQWIAQLAKAWDETLQTYPDDSLRVLAAEAGLSPEIYAEWDLRGGQMFLQRQVAEVQYARAVEGTGIPVSSERAAVPAVSTHQSLEHLARGVLVIIQNKVHPLRLMLERLVPGLLAGNSLILKFSSATPAAASFMIQVLEKAEFPEPIVRVAIGEEPSFIQILTTHPAVAGVSLFGNAAETESLFRDSFSLKRSFQAWTGGRTSLLALEPLADENWRSILRALLDGSRLMRPFDVSRVFVLESQEAEIRSALERVVGEAQWITGYSEADGQQYEKLISHLKDEEGRLIVGGEVEYLAGEAKLKPALILHLPQCSEYHQEDQGFPILLLGSVKYAFDAAKWINNASRGFAVQIYGPSDKIEKLAPKFEVARVFGPRGFDLSQNLLFGLKESAVGQTDLSPYGLFFSQERRVDGGAVL